MDYSSQQTAVIDFVRNGRGSAFVEAVAGAGKTTTLIAAVGETTGSVAFAAYNTKIAKEISAKVAALNLGNRVRVGTFHSFGLNGWKRSYPKVKFGPEADREKYDRSIEKLRGVSAPEQLHSFVMKLVSLAKQRALGLYGQIEDKSRWHSIIDHFDLAYELDDDPSFAEKGDTLVDKGIELAIRMLNWHRALSPEIINFDDMIYMPVVSGIRIWQNDWIFVDEAQDTNPARRALARKMLSRSGRAVFVGDRHQAIYGFTGADNDAIDQIVRDFNCDTLPLTVTYRCPKAVVAEAQKVVGHIQAHETAPQGEVRYTEYTNVVAGKVADGPGLVTDDVGYTLDATDAILCRNTKPLVQAAFALIKRGVACHVEGRDIGAGLLKLIGRYKVKTITALRDRLGAFAEKECQKLVAKGKETQAEALRDRVDTIFVIIDSTKPGTVDELRARITSMFLDGESEPKPTLTLCTVHRSKGREWNRVFLLGKGKYMPSPFARQQWQLDQENNLIYVATTRAKRELVYVSAALD